MSEVLHHLPVLLILIPLLSAVICLLLKGDVLPWIFTIIVIGLQFTLAVIIFGFVFQGVPVSYQVGNWTPPWGIELAIDYLNAFVLNVVIFIAFICAWYFQTATKYELIGHQANLFYCAFLLNLSGLTGVVLTADAFNLFVFIEISAISSYALVAMGHEKRALVSAFEYLIMGTIGATFTLIGLGFLYVMTGTLNMQDIAVRLSTVSETSTVWVAFSFIVVGLFIKLALFPLHSWLPSVYHFSPNIITVYFSATTTKVFIYVLIRYLFTIFGLALIGESAVPVMLMTLSCLAILYGSWQAIRANGLKQLFAYSSIAQIGYMVLGISLIDVSGLTSSMLFIINHAVVKAGIFLAIAIFLIRIPTDEIEKLPALSKYFPLSYALFVVLGLGLIGIPGTAGFISKWYLVAGVIERELWLVLLVVILGSLFSVVYMWRIIEVVGFKQSTEIKSEISNPAQTPYIAIALLAFLTLTNFYLGLNGGYFIESATTISGYLLNR